MRFVDVKNDVAFRKIFGNENKKGRIQKAEEIAEKRAQENTRNQLIVSFYENGVPLGTIAASVGISESEVQRILDTLS